MCEVNIINIEVVSRQYDTLKAAEKGKLLSTREIMFPSGMRIIEE